MVSFNMVNAGNVMGIQHPRNRRQHRAQHEGLQLRKPHILAQALAENSSSLMPTSMRPSAERLRLRAT